MSKTFWALVVKFALTLSAAWVAFRLVADEEAGPIFAIALAGTALNYVLGDLVVLPRFGNLTAAIGDGLLAALTAYVFDALSVGFNTTFGSLAVFAVLVGVVEFFFHRYLLQSKKVAP